MKKLIIIGLLFYCTGFVNAQKVAVVLSGGGSKGAAHIGVLRALEDNQIPIDYIAGTSIGAIIGGLYASGWTTDQMEQLITSEQFLMWATGAIDEKYVYYFKQPEPDASWASFRVNADSIWSFDVPTNLVSSGQMDFIFMEIFAQANAVCKGDFDSLFVPFRCIGANITDSKAEVFSGGNLVKSIRASMTYPLYFKPITIDGKMYMDGGMFNNFPADVALKDFDPDIIIGSKVAAENAVPDPDNIMSQLENIFMIETSYDLPCNSSVLIEPQIPTTNVVDFSHSAEYIKLGYDAAMSKIPQIREFVIDSVSKDEMQLRRDTFNKRKPPLVFDEVEVTGMNKMQRQYVLNYFSRRETVGIERTREDYYRLMTDHAIRTIYPMADYKDTSGSFTLNLEVKKESNILLRFGGLVSSNPVNQAFAEVSYKYLQRNAATVRANMYAGRFYSSALLGMRLDFPGHPQYALFGRIVYNQWDYFKTTSHFFEDKNPSYLIVNDYHWDCGVVVPARNKGKVTLAGSAMIIDDEYFQDNYFTRTDIPDKTNFKAWSVSAEWERNTLNKKQYANKGTLLHLRTGFVQGKENTVPGTTSVLSVDYSAHHSWFYMQFIYENYFSFMGRLRMGWYNDIYFSNRDFFGSYTATMLFANPFQPLPEMKALFMPQYRAHQYAGAGLKSIFMIRDNFDIRGEAYLCQPIRDITMGPSGIYATYGPWLRSRYFVASAGLVFHSPVGPIAITASYYDKYDEPLMLSFYFGYILFNPKAVN
ncbi:MAG TPA: patatin-like phospholipase family protein [Bacteroidales bacterium]|nr:patatin-like phospholipase family protein [Bacteroidales bacterium]